MDSRDYAAMTGGAKPPVLYLEDGTEKPLPMKFEVCPVCEGRGQHVNPSIDANGLTAEDFAEDPDFEEAYFAGRYDVRCYECHGERVVPVVDEDQLSPDELKAWRWQCDEEAADRAYELAERRMGA